MERIQFSEHTSYVIILLIGDDGGLQSGSHQLNLNEALKKKRQKGHLKSNTYISYTRK